MAAPKVKKPVVRDMSTYSKILKLPAFAAGKFSNDVSRCSPEADAACVFFGSLSVEV